MDKIKNKSFNVYIKAGKWQCHLSSKVKTFRPQMVFCLFCFVLLLIFFRAALAVYGSSRLGVKSELQLPAYTTATATWDRTYICDLHSKVLSLNHRVRLGIKPESSWILNRFITDEPWQELLGHKF